MVTHGGARRQAPWASLRAPAAPAPAPLDCGHVQHSHVHWQRFGRARASNLNLNSRGPARRCQCQCQWPRCRAWTKSRSPGGREALRGRRRWRWACSSNTCHVVHDQCTQCTRACGHGPRQAARSRLRTRRPSVHCTAHWHARAAFMHVRAVQSMSGVSPRRKHVQSSPP